MHRFFLPSMIHTKCHNAMHEFSSQLVKKKCFDNQTFIFPHLSALHKVPVPKIAQCTVSIWCAFHAWVTQPPDAQLNKDAYQRRSRACATDPFVMVEFSIYDFCLFCWWNLKVGGGSAHTPWWSFYSHINLNFLPVCNFAAQKATRTNQGAYQHRSWGSRDSLTRQAHRKLLIPAVLQLIWKSNGLPSTFCWSFVFFLQVSLSWKTNTSKHKEPNSSFLVAIVRDLYAGTFRVGSESSIWVQIPNPSYSKTNSSISELIQYFSAFWFRANPCHNPKWTGESTQIQIHKEISRRNGSSCLSRRNPHLELDTFSNFDAKRKT